MSWGLRARLLTMVTVCCLSIDDRPCWFMSSITQGLMVRAVMMSTKVMFLREIFLYIQSVNRGRRIRMAGWALERIAIPILNPAVISHSWRLL